jgi:hypothetical protein
LPTQESSVPKSRLRRRFAFTPPPEKAPVRVGSPRWLAPLMVTFFLIGLAWLVTWYITEQRYPIRDIGSWNMGVGFGFILIGFALATRWK